MKMFLGMIQKAPQGAPGVPNMQHEAPREGSGTPVAHLFHEFDAFRRPQDPNPVPGGIQNQSKNIIKITMGTNAKKVLQQLF